MSNYREPEKLIACLISIIVLFSHSRLIYVILLVCFARACRMWTGTVQNWVMILAVLQIPVVGATIAGFVGRADVSALNHC
jgi:hypothetical protein